MTLQPSPWTALREIYSHSKQRNRDAILAQFDFVYEVVRETCPSLLEPDTKTVFSAKGAAIIQKRLEQGAKVKEFQQRNRLFIQGLQRIKEQYKGEIFIPAPYVQVKRTESLLTPEMFQSNALYTEVERRFLADLETKPPQLLREQLGQILLCAILYGGLLNPSWWGPWLKSLPKLTTCRGVTWLTCEKTRRRAREDDGLNRQIIPMRWVADPLTELLLRRWLGTCDKKIDRSKGPRPETCLKTYLLRIGITVPESKPFKTLLCAAQTHLLLQGIEPFLLGCASGKLSSTPLPEAGWLRLHTGLIPKALPPLPDSSIQNENREADSGKHVALHSKLSWKHGAATLKDQQRYFLALKRAVFLKKSYPKQTMSTSVKVVRQFLETHQGQLFPALELMALWSLDLLTFHRENVNNRQVFYRRLKPVSVRRYLQSIGEQLLNEAEDKNLLEMAGEELEELYLEVTTYHRNKQEETYCGFVLARFQDFIKTNLGAEDADFSEILKTHPGEGSVARANLITPDHFDKIRDSLGWRRKNLSRMQRLRLLITILAYRCGLRRSEVRYLRLADLRGEASPELLVRTNRFADLKSTSSRRKYRLKSMLTSEELDLLMDWRQERDNEEKASPKGVLLFCLPHAGHIPVREQVFSDITEILRKVLNDPTLVFHQLRRSAANNLLLRLLPLPESVKTHPFFKHPLFSPTACDSLKRSLLGHERSGRKVLYAVAALLGHATPETTLRHYLHCSEWLLGTALSQRQRQPRLSLSALLKLTGLKPAMAYRIRARHPGEDWLALDFLPTVRKSAAAAQTEALLQAVIPVDIPESAQTKETLALPAWQSTLLAINEVQAGASPTVVAHKRKFPVPLVITWVNIADKVRKLTNRLGNSRFDSNQGKSPYFPTKPNDPRDCQMVEDIFSAARGLSDDERSLVGEGLHLFLTQYGYQSSSPRFTSVTGALKYLEFLRLLGITAAKVKVMLFLPKEKQDTDEGACIQHWSDALALPAGNFSISTRNPGKTPFGSVVLIAVNSSESRPPSQMASYGYRCGVILLLILIFSGLTTALEGTGGSEMFTSV